MVFQKPSPFPVSIYDNIVFGPRTPGIRSRARLEGIIEQSVRCAAIWDKMKVRLKRDVPGLSGGQQQRLCIARALAVEPEVLLTDEPISASRIVDLALQPKSRYTIVMVTHSMQQATRTSGRTAFFLPGEAVEYGETRRLLSMPKDKRTEACITGRFG